MLVKVNQTRELVDALGDDFEAAVDFLRAKAAAGGISGPPPKVHTGHGYRAQADEKRRGRQFDWWAGLTSLSGRSPEAIFGPGHEPSLVRAVRRSTDLYGGPIGLLRMNLSPRRPAGRRCKLACRL